MKPFSMALFVACLPVVACNIDRDFLYRFDAGHISSGNKSDARIASTGGATGTGGKIGSGGIDAGSDGSGGGTTGPDADSDAASDAGLDPNRGGAGFSEFVEISEPIFLNVKVAYAAQGANFPADGPARAALAHDASLTFDFLLGACRGTHPEIVVRGPNDPPLTAKQIATNRGSVAACAYELYTSKPYWTPALVNDVDICGTELGTDWHLITEDDVNTLSESDAQTLFDTLTPAITSVGLGSNYFSMTVWVRGSDGSLRRADLSPGVHPRVTDLPVPPTSPVHYEGGLALRCARHSKTRPPLAAGFAQWVEISPPILPNLKVTYPYEAPDVSFPATHAARVALAHEAALTFDFLLGVCAPTHPEITVPVPGGPPLTPAQNAVTLNALAQCALATYMSKPYWTPVLVDEVDICATELGAHWHLVAEEDANLLSSADADALTAALSTPSGMGHVFFGMKTWARGGDGSLRQADLSAASAPRVTALPVASDSTIHYEGELALRCTRRTPVPTP